MVSYVDSVKVHQGQLEAGAPATAHAASNNPAAVT